MNQLSEAAALFALSSSGVAAFGYSVVRGAEALADRYRLDRFAVGFIFLSVVTSVPELTVAVIAGLRAAVELSVGDLLGSSVVNITFVTGLAVLFAAKGVAIGRGLRANLTWLLFLSSLIPVLLLLVPRIPPITGLPLILVFLTYGIYASRSRPVHVALPSLDAGWRVFTVVAIGVVGLVTSATALVQSAKALSEVLGIGQLEIGAKLVSLVTSMPEIVTVAASMRRGEYEMAFGNAVGSNLTNMSLMLGSLLLIAGVDVFLSPHYATVLFVVLVSGTLWAFSLRGRISRPLALVLLVEYVAFLLFSD
ncbi:MAG: hypothetical protein NZ957_05865 [Thaumarchaeota archaeon]|nr:hypothetical protein [Candidatus Calditenuaceae archaeon]